MRYIPPPEKDSAGKGSRLNPPADAISPRDRWLEGEPQLDVRNVNFIGVHNAIQIHK